MNHSNGSSRQTYLDQGAELVNHELDDQAREALDLGQRIELRNVDLFSSSLIANKDVHQTVKERIRERSANIRKIIAATAYFIEQEKFKSVDEAISKAGLELSKYDQQRLTALASSQRKISLSYATLSAVVEVFKRANSRILDEIRRSGFADDGVKRVEKTKMFLKNAIIVYELTSFVIDYLSSFGLAGLSDLEKIQADVLADIKKGRADDQSLRSRLAKASEAVRTSTQKEIEEREVFRSKVIEKWCEIMAKIKNQIKMADNVKSSIPDLEIIRDNTRSRIDILNITATTALVENSITAIDALSTGLQGWELPALDENTARELLNLGL